MEPHHHAEETIYVVDARDAGMIPHFPELEWHVFEWDEGGYVDALFIYGQVDNILPRPDQALVGDWGHRAG